MATQYMTIVLALTLCGLALIFCVAYYAEKRRMGCLLVLCGLALFWLYVIYLLVQHWKGN